MWRTRRDGEKEGCLILEKGCRSRKCKLTDARRYFHELASDLPYRNRTVTIPYAYGTHVFLIFRDRTIPSLQKPFDFHSYPHPHHPCSTPSRVRGELIAASAGTSSATPPCLLSCSISPTQPSLTLAFRLCWTSHTINKIPIPDYLRPR